MSDCVAWTSGRAFRRLALAGLGLLLLSGCSSDVTRFTQSHSPFSNPFASKRRRRADARRDGRRRWRKARPQRRRRAAASLSKPQAVGGSAVGWTAVGGSPIVVANGETLDTLSGRYGVPAAALLSANGLSSASEVKSGMRSVVPVYHADGHAVASAEKERSARKRDGDVADAEPAKSAKSKAKDKEKEKAAKADKAGQGGGEVRGEERQGRRGRARRSRPSRRRPKSRRSTRRRRATSNPARRKQRSR